MEGWVSVYRKLASTDLWLKQKFTKGQAWVDLIILANHKDGIIEKRGQIVSVKRGQIGWSELALSIRWKWSRNKTTRFLFWLENENQIIQQRKRVTTLITVVNYEKYQNPEKYMKQQKIQQKDNRSLKTIQQKDTNNNDNKRNNENKKIYIAVIDYLNKRTEKKFKTTKGNIKWIEVRLNEGHTLEDFEKVIDIKTSQWKNNSDNNKFLRPETLFGNKFDGYLNEILTPKGTEKVAGVEAYKDYKPEVIDSKMPKGYKDSEQYKRIKKL